MSAPIILAVDTSDLEIAKSWILATQESVSVYKLGLEFYLKDRKSTRLNSSHG